MPKHETRNILLNNLGSKHSLVMKFDHFMYYQRKNLTKTFNEKCDLKASPSPF